MAENYKVTQQHQTIELNPAGTGFMNVWEITYKVTSGPAKGTVASVTVPEEDHTPDQVKAAIEDKIKALSQIASLGT